MENVDFRQSLDKVPVKKMVSVSVTVRRMKGLLVRTFFCLLPWLVNDINPLVYLVLLLTVKWCFLDMNFCCAVGYHPLDVEQSSTIQWIWNSHQSFLRTSAYLQARASISTFVPSALNYDNLWNYRLLSWLIDFAWMKLLTSMCIVYMMGTNVLMLNNIPASYTQPFVKFPSPSICG